MEREQLIEIEIPNKFYGIWLGYVGDDGMFRGKQFFTNKDWNLMSEIGRRNQLFLYNKLYSSKEAMDNLILKKRSEDPEDQPYSMCTMEDLHMHCCQKGQFAAISRGEGCWEAWVPNFIDFKIAHTVWKAEDLAVWKEED